MKRHFSLLSTYAGIALFAAFLFSISNAYAIAPTLSLSLSSSNNGSVDVNVTGDPNVPVTFYYNIANPADMQFVQLGNTNTSGTLSLTVSSGTYPINPGTSVYVYLNGQQSPTQTWPAVVAAPTGVNSGSLAFTPASPSVSIGQTVNVNVTGGTGYSLSTNASPGIASAAMNGSAVAVTGIASGSTLITVCSSSNGCNSFTATVGSGGTSSGGVSFDQPNPMLAIGQTVNVNITGGSSYYISNNTNPGVIAATLNGSAVSILGGSTGSAVVIICSASNGCANISATVGSNSSSASTGGVTFGQTNPTMQVGQTLSVSLSGGSGSYFISTATGLAASPSIVGNSLSLLGQNTGSSSITVCSSSGGCGTLSVTVTSAATTIATVTPTPTPTFTSQTTSNSSVLAQIAALQAEIVQILAQIQTIQSKLAQLTAQVKNATPAGGAATSALAGGYQFLNPMSLGSKGADVTALQTLLTAKGFYSGPVSGYYGTLTMDAVMAYQTAHGITPLGNVGPGTRAALNAGQ